MHTVSIITPNFNRADVIKETAESIFNQTNPNWEWVIVDDGSTDNSLEILRAYAAKDSRVKVLQRARQPKGAAACRNIGVENSTGDYLLFLDSDDLIASFCLEQRLNAAKANPDCDFLIFQMIMFKKEISDTGLLWNIDNETDDFTRTMLGDPICQGTGTIWKRKSLIDLGMWDEDLLLWQDVELHLRTFLSGLSYKKMLNLPPDTFIRLSEVSLSRTGFNSLPKFQSRMKVYTDTLKKAEQLNVLGQYKGSLTRMGFDMICTAIFHNYFDEADKLFEINSSANLFDENLIKKVKRYYWIKKGKLYKLPLLSKLSERPQSHLFQNYITTLGKVKYQGQILG